MHWFFTWFYHSLWCVPLRSHCNFERKKVLRNFFLLRFIYSIGSIDDTLDYTLYFPYNQFQNSPFFYYNLWGLLGFMIWCGYISLGIYQFVLMGTASHWYFRDTHIDAESRRKGIKRRFDEITYSSQNIVKWVFLKKNFYGK